MQLRLWDCRGPSGVETANQLSISSCPLLHWIHESVHPAPHAFQRSSSDLLLPPDVSTALFTQTTSHHDLLHLHSHSCWFSTTSCFCSSALSTFNTIIYLLHLFHSVKALLVWLFVVVHLYATGKSQCQC